MYSLLGLAYLLQNKNNIAFTNLYKAIEYAKENDEINDSNANLIIAYCHIKEYSKALDCCEKAMNKNNNEAIFYYLKGAILNALGDKKGSEKCQNKVFELDIDFDIEQYTHKIFAKELKIKQ